MDQNFYEAGANSLMLARAAGNLNKEINCKATFDSWLVQLLNSPTAREAAIFAETEKISLQTHARITHMKLIVTTLSLRK